MSIDAGKMTEDLKKIVASMGEAYAPRLERETACPRCRKFVARMMAIAGCNHLWCEICAVELDADPAFQGLREKYDELYWKHEAAIQVGSFDPKKFKALIAHRRLVGEAIRAWVKAGKPLENKASEVTT